MENNSNKIIIKEQTSGCLGCLVWMIMLPIIVAIGYFVVGTIIWFIPFILACLIIVLVGYFVLKGIYILLKTIFG